MTQKATTSQPRLMLGIAEAAERIGVSAGFLRLEIRRGALSAKRLGRRVLISVAELERYLQPDDEPSITGSRRAG